jgi:hypothetical protein
MSGASTIELVLERPRRGACRPSGRQCGDHEGGSSSAQLGYPA